MLRATVCESHSKGSPFSIPDMAVMELMARVFFSLLLYLFCFVSTYNKKLIYFISNYLCILLYLFYFYLFYCCYFYLFYCCYFYLIY